MTVPKVKKGERTGYSEERDALILRIDRRTNSEIFKMYSNGRFVHRYEDWDTGSDSNTTNGKPDSSIAAHGAAIVFEAFNRHQRAIPKAFEKLRPTV